jgi:beta-lactam-binding protein with PASTA domain
VFKFITRQHFLVNLLIAIALLFGIVFMFLSFLDIITKHNEYTEVPSVVNKNLNAAVEALEAKGFKVEIQDSSWNPDVAPLMVMRQSPEPGQTVKANRLIFLTVNKSQPPLVDMPNLVGFSFRNAMLFINQIGLKLGDTLRKADIAKDAVLGQFYQGKPIVPGTRIFTGSTISFVLGSGLGENDFEVPDIYGLTYSEAKLILHGMNLNIGGFFPDPDVKDTLKAYVYRQNPNSITFLPDGSKQVNRMREGQSLDIWLSTDKKERLFTPDMDSIIVKDDENNKDN